MSERDEILLTALKIMGGKFDEFITSCMGEDGNPKAPSYKALMKARGYLPPYCKNALKKNG